MKQDAYAMTLLFDYYGELLTEKQKTCFDLYYNQDLSLSEIAEEAGITRQGVHDTLARAESVRRHREDTAGCGARAARPAGGPAARAACRGAAAGGVRRRAGGRGAVAARQSRAGRAGSRCRPGGGSRLGAVDRK